MYIDDTAYALDQTWNVNDALYHGTVNGENVVAQLMDRRSDRLSLQFLGTKFDMTLHTRREHELAAYIPEPVVKDTSNMLVSPMPGKVLSVDVKAGDKVRVRVISV